MKKQFFLCLVALLCLAACEQKKLVEIGRLQTEGLVNPRGIDCLTPRLSWELTSGLKDVQQVAYQIRVASSLEKLNAGEADLWDSGKVLSDESIQIAYGGVQPTSRMDAYWTVQVETNKGLTEWSEPASWSMALLNASDWQANWVGLDTIYPGDAVEGNTRLAARYFRKDFELESQEIKKATLYISGVGFYEAYVNAARIGEQVLAPTPTDYSKTVKYNTFDVTDQLAEGQNAIGVIVGNGRYYSMRMPGVRHFGYPKMIAQLEVTYANGETQTIVSDDSWKVTAAGPILSNSEFDGEAYDARKEMPGWNAAGYTDGNWIPAAHVESPGGVLEAQLNRNIKIMETLKPIAIHEPKPGMYILDMGQNMVGWLRMQAKGKTGDRVQLRFAELLKDDGTLYMDNLRTALVTDTYTFKSDDTETWQPTFTYHGFRYVELTGFQQKPALQDFEGLVLYDEMEVTGHFETSDSTINQVYKNAYWGIRGNYRGMPTDCPQRDERMGWLGDRAVGSLGESFIFNNHLLYAKWLDDIEQAQRPNGAVPDVAPNYWDVCTDNMTWPGAYLIMADMLYEQYGDKQPLTKHYDSMKRWMTYMKDTYMVDHIMPKDNFGDWCMPPESPELIHSKDPARITDAAVLGTTFYYHLLNIMTRFATLTEHAADATRFTAEAAAMKEAFNVKYLNKEQGYYSNNTVTANILPLRFGMVPDEYKEAVFNSIVKKTMGDFNGHVSTGLVGIQQLMRGLSDYGRSDVAWKIATNRDYPSWGYMIENGATTIWELWNGGTADPAMNSANHVMLLGDLVVWYYEYLAGIKNMPGSYGFKEIEMKPYPVEGLNYVDASYQSVRGLIQSSWKKENGAFTWQITIPCNTSARVYIPVSSAGLSDQEKQQITSQGANFVDTEGSYAIFKVPSGSYVFAAAM